MTTWAEEQVLKPLDPVPDDVNEWPDFALTEVKIFQQGKGRYADLLEASDENPLCVLGELLPLEDEQADLALIEDLEYTRIKIDNVTNYSFGQDETGKPVVWAAGKAGWYEITPSDRYMSHYSDTIEAIDLFYFMVDQHHKLPQKRQRLGFKIDPFLTEYQRHTDYRIDDDDEAMETIHKHHKFLLKQMSEEREGVDWSQTYLWKHLAETYADEVEILHEKMRQVKSVVRDSASESDYNNESSESNAQDSDTSEMAVEDATDKEESASGGSDSEASDATDWTRPIWDLLNILRKTNNFSMRDCGIDRLATELEKRGIFPSGHKAAVAAIERCAEPLLRLMNEAKLRKKFNWSTRAIYDELEATLADEIADNTENLKKPGNKLEKRHRKKSVLRPSGAGAGKARKRTRKAGARASEDDDDEDDEDEDAAMREAPVLSNSPAMRRTLQGQRHREMTIDSVESREDSPSRQLNGHFDPNALPELPPAPEAQEMLDLVVKEAKMVGRQHQTSHLQAFLEQWVV